MQCFYPVADPKLGLRPCGQCAACMVQKHLQWKFRLTQEVLDSDLALWCTLQYEDEHLFYVDERPAVCKKHCQNFFHKFRKSISEKNLNVTFKYFLVSEYGPKTNRPHYHVLLLFKMPSLEIEPMLRLRQALYEEVKLRWYHGHSQISLFHRGVVRYLTKYVFKPFSEFDPPVKTFRLISKGIGENYLNYIDYDRLRKDLTWKTPEGVIPRYYRDKLFPTMKGAAFWNTEFRGNMYLKTMDNIWNREIQKQRQFDSVDSYIKNQKYLLQCQKRLVERKEKQKYG